MKKIVVPTDFSEQSVSAFRFALDVAYQAKAQIYLLHVIELPVLNDAVLMPVLDYEEEFLSELKEHAAAKLSAISRKYSHTPQKVTAVTVVGNVHRTIVDFVDKQQIDLVVVGTKGAGGIKEVVIGSNAEKIVRKSGAPVIAVKAYVDPKSIRNIVFANSFQIAQQEKLVEKIKALQSFFNAALHLVWINTPLNFTSDAITLRRIEGFAKHYGLKNYTTHVFNDNSEPSGILHFANFIKGDLIAMGTHGRTGLQHVISGSLAEDIVNHVDYPVWTYVAPC